MPFVLANDFARPRSRDPTALSRTIGDFRKPGRNRSVAKDDVERIPQLTGCMLASLLLNDRIRINATDYAGKLHPDQSAGELFRGLADRVRHGRAARAQRLRRTDGRVACRLMLDLGIEFGPEQHGDSREP